MHNECRAAAPLPCVPLLSTPSSKQDGSLKSYVPKNPPHIPSILVRCIQEIESRGFSEQGLYRVNGSGIYIYMLHAWIHTGVQCAHRRIQFSNQICCKTSTPPKIFQLDPRFIRLNLPFWFFILNIPFSALIYSRFTCII